MSETESGSASNYGVDQARLRDPQAVYEESRKQGPALRGEGSVTTTTRAAADAVLRNPGLFCSAEVVNLGNARPLIPLQIDPPNHSKYRKILDPIFAPRQMALIEDSVAALVNDHIDRFIDRGECDFTTELAVPLPSQVFLTLLGAPLEDTALLLRLKDGILRPSIPEDADVSEPLAMLAAGQEARTGTGREIYAYFTDLIAERRKTPREDIISRFLTTEIDGVQLTDDDILDIGFLFLIAGLDTVTDSLTCFYAYLSQHPDHRSQIADDPGVIPAVVEELLRWETPVPAVVRTATIDGDIEGCPVKQGDFVAVGLGSANTDPAFLEDADIVRFDREANPHIAFGGGLHRCLGSHLARQELRVTLREWHNRIPEYRLKPGVEMHYVAGLRSVENLWLTWK